MKAALARLDIGPRDATQISDAEAYFYADLLERERLSRTLEIGLGLGKSAVAIMATIGTSHIAIDPFQDDFGRRGIENVDRAGFSDRLVLMEEHSHIALPKLLMEGKRFDFIFIDGGHRFDSIFVDFYYADLLLEDRGYIAFDDLWMRTARLVLSFIRTNRADYAIIPGAPRTTALVQKTGVDTRDGMFHREFYTPRSMVTHYGNLWLSTGEDTLAKRAGRRVKRLIYRRRG